MSLNRFSSTDSVGRDENDSRVTTVLPDVSQYTVCVVHMLVQYPTKVDHFVGIAFLEGGSNLALTKMLVFTGGGENVGQTVVVP